MTEAQYKAYLARHAPVTREAELQARIRDFLRSQGALFINPRMDLPTTIGAGAPDFIILLPTARVLLVECKRPGGKLSIEQSAWHMHARRLGHHIFVVQSFREFMAIWQRATNATTIYEHEPNDAHDSTRNEPDQATEEQHN